MGATQSHEDPPPVPRPPPRRPSLGPRPQNLRRHSSPPTTEPNALSTALFRDPTRAPRDLRPIEYRPPVQQSQIVRNVVSLSKSSLVLRPAPFDPTLHLVEFEFDAFVDGFITIYYAAREVLRRAPGSRGNNAPVVQVSYVGKGDVQPVKTRFGVGRHQKYRQKPDKALDLRKFTANELRYRPDSDRYPVVIRLEAVYPPDSPVPEHMRVKSQTTLASLHQVDGQYAIQVIAQQVLVRGTIHRVQDLYGIGAADVTATKHADSDDTTETYSVDGNHECVICLTEPCNTAVLPCNHLCLCDDCARILCTETDHQRRKCPVCRTQLGSLLRIISAPSREGAESEAVVGNTVRPSSTAAATVAQSDSVPSVDTEADDEQIVADASVAATTGLRAGRQESQSCEGSTVAPTPSTV